MESDDDKTHTHIVLTKGTMVSHYRIVGKIGAGGMGEVYLAEDTELDRKVALKSLPPHLCQDEDCRARFKREAQAAAKLSHPNIIHVYEVSEYQGRPFFAMEHVDGLSLKEYASASELSVEEILEFGIQICEGLQEAHDKGIIHRDIKPSNILIGTNSRPRIIDFGLASVVGQDPLTKAGSTLGTVGYMSPEQVRGQNVDYRTDLFSIGVVLYELFTGQNPFRKENEAATLRAVTDDIPHPVARYRADIPDGLQAIMDKSLEKDADMRFQSASGLASELKRLARGLQQIPSIRTDVPSVAVMPFANLSADPKQEYFCDGMAEEIINALTHIEGLRVVARTSSFAFKGRNEDIREIGKKLNVAHVLEGSVRKAGNRIRITGQLIKVADGYHLWSERYDRELNDIFDVQDEISIAIVENLKVKLLGGEHEHMVKRPTENLEAYTFYLKGRYHWSHRGAKEIEKAIECLRKSVELDPKFPLGYAGLADAYIIQRAYVDDFEAQSAVLRLAEQMVSRALELDQSLGEAHTALAQIKFAQWKWADVEREHLLAIKLNPRYATAYHWYGLFLGVQGKFADAVTYMKHARELDPISSSIIGAHAILCYLGRRYDEALRICREGFEINPNSPDYSVVEGWTLAEKGKYDEAEASLNRGIERVQVWKGQEDDPINWMPHIGIVYAKRGDHAKARSILEDMLTRTKERNTKVFSVAALCIVLGELETGFRLLKQAIDNTEFWIPLFRHSPFFDSVRHDPRFIALMAQIGLSDKPSEVSDE